MAEPELPVWCVRCGVENAGRNPFCRYCGRELRLSDQEHRAGTAFLLTQLESLRRDGLIARHTYILLRDRYRSVLGGSAGQPDTMTQSDRGPPAPEAAPQATEHLSSPIAQAASGAAAQTSGAAKPIDAGTEPELGPAPSQPHRPTRPKREGPSWFAEQQANFLLYLGAFLVIIATLIFVSRSDQAISDSVRMVILTVYTMLFLAVGVGCMRYPRVRQAGDVFFAIGALMVPLNFVGAYAFFYANEDIDPAGLWLAGSLTSALFYGAVSLSGLGRWYPVPAVAALASAVAALLWVLGATPEAYPASYILLAFVLIAPSIVRLGNMTKTFGEVGFYAAHATLPAAIVAAVVLAVYGYADDADTALGVGTLWYLPPTFALAAVFYGVPAWRGMGSWHAWPAVVAALASFASGLAAAEMASEAYPASLVAAGFVLVVPSMRRVGRISEVFGEAAFWTGNAVVPLAALSAVAMSTTLQDADASIGIASLWFLPPTLAATTAFYGVLAFQVDRWYSMPAIAAGLATLGFTLAATGVASEVYPAAFIGAAFLLALPSLRNLGRTSEAFEQTGLWAANVTVPLAALAALWLPTLDSETGENLAGIGSLWYLPPTLAAAAGFYVVLALRVDRQWSIPAVGLALGALAGLLVASDAPPEAYPGSFAAAAVVLALPSLLPLGRVTTAFAGTGSVAGHVVVPIGVLSGLGMTISSVYAGNEPWFVLNTRWYLPPTAALAAIFYWMQAFSLKRSYPAFEPYVTVAALGVSGGAVVTVVYALELGEQWYGPAVAIVGWAYALGSEGIGPRWSGQRYLGWLAAGAITASCLLFEGIYADWPRLAAGVHFSAAAFYLSAAVVVRSSIPLLALYSSGEQEDAEPDYVSLPAAALFVYATGLAIGLGFYYLLSSLPAGQGAEPSDTAWPFFGLSLVVASAAATLRLWRPELRAHAYLVALGMSLFALLASADAEGQVALMLALYTIVTLALSVWEREPLALSLPATFAFFAVLAAWRYYDPDDAYFPLVFSALAMALYTAHLVMRSLEPIREETEQKGYAFGIDWKLAVLGLTVVFATVAPIAGWIRLSYLADPQGFVGGQSFEETALYQTCSLAVLIFGLLVVTHGLLVRNAAVAVAGTPLLMIALLLEIGHFRPDSVLWYSIPLGAYLVVTGIYAPRVRELPDDVRQFIEPFQAFAACVLLGPLLVQAWEADGWPYALILLGAGLALIAIALVQRWVWLLAVATGFVVLDSVRYLVSAAREMPVWAGFAIAGLLALSAGTAILFSRERWNEWQRSVETWWKRDTLPTENVG